jgi:PncC family amidohydrolase
MYSIIKLIKTHQLTIGTVESVTGGLLSNYFVKHKGASSFFVGAIVAYQDQAKEKLLHIPSSLIAKGVVSNEFVKAMVLQGLTLIPSDIIIATTGNAGPQVLPHSQPGEIFIAVGSKDHVLTKKIVLSGTRQKNRSTTASESLLLLKDFINTYY